MSEINLLPEELIKLTAQKGWRRKSIYLSMGLLLMVLLAMLGTLYWRLLSQREQQVWVKRSNELIDKIQGHKNLEGLYRSVYGKLQVLAASKARERPYAELFNKLEQEKPLGVVLTDLQAEEEKVGIVVTGHADGFTVLSDYLERLAESQKQPALYKLRVTSLEIDNRVGGIIFSFVARLEE